MKKTVLRPPGVRSQTEFDAKCISCGQCQAVCLFYCIEMHSDSFLDVAQPRIIVEKAPCFLCMRCSQTCPTKALNAVSPDQANMGKAIIGKKCLNYQENQETMCWTCYEKCPLKGAAIKLEFGYLPQIQEACVGCGVCAYVCPVQAISIKATFP